MNFWKPASLQDLLPMDWRSVEEGGIKAESPFPTSTTQRWLCHDQTWRRLVTARATQHGGLGGGTGTMVFIFQLDLISESNNSLSYALSLPGYASLSFQAKKAEPRGIMSELTQMQGASFQGRSLCSPSRAPSRLPTCQASYLQAMLTAVPHDVWSHPNLSLIAPELH